jgi:TRAP-type C4-dicarboxylate transport system permease small subunit
MKTSPFPYLTHQFVIAFGGEAMTKMEADLNKKPLNTGFNFWRRYDAVLTVAENIFFVFAGILVGITLVALLVSVAGRYFGLNMAWSIELSEYMMLYIAFLAAPWLLRNDHHIKVELLISLFKEGNRKKINLMTSLLAAIACLILFWFGLESTIDHFQRGIIINNVMKMPKYIPLLIIPVGSLLLFLRYIHKIWGIIVSKD